MPNVSAMWVLRTSDNDNSDPYLAIFDPHGVLIASDDDSAGGFNAEIVVFLVAGRTYTVDAKFYWGGDGSYTLTVRQQDD